MTVDLRDKQATEKAKYNDQFHTLNANVHTHKNLPQILSDQAG